MGNQRYKPKSHSHVDDILDRLMTAIQPEPQPPKEYIYLCDIGARR